MEEWDEGEREREEGWRRTIKKEGKEKKLSQLLSSQSNKYFTSELLITIATGQTHMCLCFSNWNQFFPLSHISSLLKDTKVIQTREKN